MIRLLGRYPPSMKLISSYYCSTRKQKIDSSPHRSLPVYLIIRILPSRFATGVFKVVKLVSGSLCFGLTGSIHAAFCSNRVVLDGMRLFLSRQTREQGRTAIA